MNSDVINYRRCELGVALELLFRDDVGYDDKIEIVKAIHDKSTRIFHRYIKNNGALPEIIGFFKTHLSSLRRDMEGLYIYETLRNISDGSLSEDSRISDELDKILCWNMEDLLGLYNDYTRLLRSCQK